MLIKDIIKIKFHIGIIDQILDKYFSKNYLLDKIYFSVKFIILILLVISLI